MHDLLVQAGRACHLGESMDPADIWSVRASGDPAADAGKIDRETALHFLGELSRALDTPIEPYREQFAGFGAYVRWRTTEPIGKALGLALDGSFAVLLKRGPPEITATFLVYSAGERVFPPEREQGYVTMAYRQQGGWGDLIWWMDEAFEFAQRSYTGPASGSGSVTPPAGDGSQALPGLLAELFGHPLRIGTGETPEIESEHPLFGLLRLSVRGQVRPTPGQPPARSRHLEIPVALRLDGRPLLVGSVALQGVRILEVRTEDGRAWSFGWRAP
jgi:hypothetical protein